MQIDQSEQGLRQGLAWLRNELFGRSFVPAQFAFRIIEPQQRLFECALLARKRDHFHELQRGDRRCLDPQPLVNRGFGRERGLVEPFYFRKIPL